MPHGGVCSSSLGVKGFDGAAVLRYNWAIERNDKALVDHFFVSERQPPWLCTLDLPGHTIYDVPDEDPAADKQHAPTGPLCTQASTCCAMCMHTL